MLRWAMRAMRLNKGCPAAAAICSSAYSSGSLMPVSGVKRLRGSLCRSAAVNIGQLTDVLRLQLAAVFVLQLAQARLRPRQACLRVAAQGGH
jgi:hypothetical protein